MPFNSNIAISTETTVAMAETMVKTATASTAARTTKLSLCM